MLLHGSLSHHCAVCADRSALQISTRSLHDGGLCVVDTRVAMLNKKSGGWRDEDIANRSCRPQSSISATAGLWRHLEFEDTRPNRADAAASSADALPSATPCAITCALVAPVARISAAMAASNASFETPGFNFMSGARSFVAALAPLAPTVDVATKSAAMLMISNTSHALAPFLYRALARWGIQVRQDVGDPDRSPLDTPSSHSLTYFVIIPCDISGCVVSVCTWP